MLEDADVLVVGSGAAGMMAALRASALGLKPIVIEKARQYGGTTATSGGIFWTPCHDRGGLADDPEIALEYLRTVTAGKAREERLRAFIEQAPQMAAFLAQAGIPNLPHPTSDYFPDAPGSRAGRSLRVEAIDGLALLGDDYLRMRAPNSLALLFDRYSIDAREGQALVKRTRGWPFVAARLFARYWLDLPMRARSRRDRRAIRGDALVGRLYHSLQQRRVPVLLDCAMRELSVTDGRITGAVVEHLGGPRRVAARRGVVLAAGGFEHDQKRRKAHLPVYTEAAWTTTPPGGNAGDALGAGEAIGAGTEFLDRMWWQPVVRLPSRRVANLEVPYGLALDQRHPHSIIVNRNGVRFASEGLSYDRFGGAMVRDQLEHGANVPCWIVFDATFRRRYALGGLLPSLVMPDRRIPRDWWDAYLFRDTAIGGLAARIGLRPEQLESTVARFNAFCAEGVDHDFGRGSNAYDRAWGDPRVHPNPSLGPIAEPPFYAVRVDLGDLGCKGGLKCDGAARVLDTAGVPIPGLYAAGNSAGSPFADAYPGAGATIGAALTFGYIAANTIAEERS
jgi:3-oxosteroid 1-dehydrogenase